MKSLLSLLVSFILLSAGIPKDIYDITWYARNGDKGVHFVIYKDHSGAVKAVWQQEGVDVFVVESIIYEVSRSRKRLHFKNGLRMLGQDDMPIENIDLAYSKRKAGFVSRKRAKPYKIIAERPIIYSKYGWLINLEELKANTYEKTDFQ